MFFSTPYFALDDHLGLLRCSQVPGHGQRTAVSEGTHEMIFGRNGLRQVQCPLPPSVLEVSTRGWCPSAWPYVKPHASELPPPSTPCCQLTSDVELTPA